MNDEPLMEALIDVLLFLDLSDEEAVDEDAAVDVLEQIGAQLQRLDSSTKHRFVQRVLDRARETESKEQREALESLPEDFGLI
jgi:hypothetical protein